MAVVGQDTAEKDVFSITTVSTLNVQVRFAYRKGFGIHLLAEEVDLSLGIDLLDMFFGNGEHATGAATGITDGTDNMILAQRVLVLGEEEVDHEANNFPWCKVFPRIFVQRLIKLADQLLEDIAHLDIGDDVGMQINIFEAFQDQEEQASLIELADGILKVKFLQDLAHVVR